MGRGTGRWIRLAEAQRCRKHPHLRWWLLPCVALRCRSLNHVVLRVSGKRARQGKARMPAKKPFGVKLDDATLARVRAVQARLSSPWRDATLSDTLRVLVLQSLARVEEHGADALRNVLGDDQDEAPDGTEDVER